MKKRIVTMMMLLVLVLAIGMLTACNRNGDDNDGGNQPATGTGTNDTGTPAAPAGAFDEHIVISMSIMDAHNAGRDNYLEDGGRWVPWVQHVMDKFNVSFDLYNLSWGDFIDVTNMWLQTGIAPDIMFMDISPGRFGGFYINATQDRLFRPYNLDNMPNMRRALEEGPTALQAFKINGNLYAWAGPSDGSLFITPYRMTGFSYRRDWAEAVGHAQPDSIYTYQQWKDMIAAVQAANPGNVPGGVIGIASVDWMMPRDWPAGMLLYGVNRYVQLPDGSYTWGPLTPEALQTVQLMNQLYQEGIMWEDQFMAAGDMATDLFMQNRAFAQIQQNILFNTLSYKVQQFIENNGGEATLENMNYHAENVIRFGLVENPNGTIVAPEMGGIWGQTVMNANISDAAAERWEAIMEYLVTTEGYLMRSFGMRGTDWDFDANGDFVLMWDTCPDEGHRIDPHWDYNVWGFGRLAGNLDGRHQIWMPETVNQVLLAQYEALLDVLHGPRATRIPFDFALEYHTGPEFLNIGSMSVEFNDQVAALLLVSPDQVEPQLNAWLNQRRPMIQPVIDELNAMLR